MKMSVIYHSVTGNTKNMGEYIVKGMNSIDGVSAKSFSIDDVDFDYVSESQCVILGSPIYAFHITGQMLDFLLKDGKKLNLSGKICGAYTTAQYVHGGGEFGIQELLNNMLVLGGLVYSGGASLGKPVIHLGPVGIDKTMDIEQFAENFEIYGKRMAEKTIELFS